MKNILGRTDYPTPYKITADTYICIIFKDYRRAGLIDFPVPKKFCQSYPVGGVFAQCFLEDDVYAECIKFRDL